MANQQSGCHKQTGEPFSLTLTSASFVVACRRQAGKQPGHAAARARQATAPGSQLPPTARLALRLE